MKIYVQAKPAAKQDKVKEVEKNEFVVSVTEPPIQGRANQAIIKLLAKHFEVSKSQVNLVLGFSSRQKIFEISMLHK